MIQSKNQSIIEEVIVASLGKEKKIKKIHIMLKLIHSFCYTQNLKYKKPGFIRPVKHFWGLGININKT